VNLHVNVCNKNPEGKHSENCKKNNLLKHKEYQIPKYKLIGGPFFRINLSGGGSHPCPLSVTPLVVTDSEVLM